MVTSDISWIDQFGFRKEKLTFLDHQQANYMEQFVRS
jgi:hypothetical protein